MSVKKKQRKFVSKINLMTTAMEFSMAPVCRGWDFVRMTKKLACLSRMGLCHDDLEARVSVEDGTCHDD